MRYSGLSALPEALRENINNTLDVNLAMPYTYFDDAKCLNLLKEYGDDGLEDLFLSSPEGKYRSDICRTVYLYQNGGFYVDLDFELVKPLTNLVDANTSFMSAWTMTGDILNALMGAEPKSAILKRTITLMTRFTDFKPRRPNATRRLPNASLREGTHCCSYYPGPPARRPTHGGGGGYLGEAVLGCIEADVCN